MSKRIIEISDADLRKRTRRAFLIGGVSAAAGVAGYAWMTHQTDDSDTPLLERRAMNLNGTISRAYLSDAHLMPEYAHSRVERLKPNGDIGLKNAVEPDWELDVVTHAGPALSFNLADIQALPRRELVTRFCCIEGWSTITQWAGARFSDFTRKVFPPGHALPDYVKMATPDQDYYVGLDMKSALHPQTLLAWELNGSPLRPEHGAPLRLVIPVKYGIKNIKRIGSIEYTSQRPGDYWAEQGYDWFAGL